MNTPYCLLARTLQRLWLGLTLAVLVSSASAAFVHPGGVHTQADLDRMKTQVAANASPWIESWNALLLNSKAQTTYSPAPTANPGQNRQRASADAVAAYLNAIRGYVGDSTAHTDKAISILNAWSSTVNQIPTGADQPGLNGIFTYQFAVVGEILRIHVGTRWAQADFERFQNMMTQYLYPVCNDFLVNHRGTCISHYWANWDLCNMAAILAIGVLCDDQAKFDEAIAYFQTGAGNGSILNAVPFVHPGNLGQWQETGRDQEHALLGLGMMATFCEIARNQGVDMYGYSNNRLLAAAEYTAKYNLWNDVPYSFYNNCDNVKNYWPGEYTWGGRGRLQRPIWEQLYNHYVVRLGLSAPYLTAMASVNRPEALSHDDHFGYGTLAFTLAAASSPYPPALPSAPSGLVATAGVGRVFLKWAPSDRARGYNVLRATASGGPYTNVGTWTGTYPVFTDTGMTNGTTYHYAIQAINQAGTTGNSAEASATPQAAGALPPGWTRTDIGTNGTAGSASYANVAGGTFVFTASGAGIGGTTDGCSFLSTSATGDTTITVRRNPPTWGGGGSQKIGLMMRESNSADSPMFTLTTGDVGTREARAGARTVAGGSTSWTGGNAYTWGHGDTWMRLQRVGNTFTASQSTDGATWFTVLSTTIAMPSIYSVGMVIGSNSTATISTHFDNLTVSTAASPPPAPGGLAATAGDTQVSLNWTASSGATSYNVKRATVSGGPYTTVASPTTASYTDTTVINGTTYYYVVSAVNANGESANSSQASATPQAPQPPPAPAGLTATAGNAQVSLSWAASAGATSYNVKRATVSGGPYATIASPTTTSYTDTTVTNGTTYYYVVSAVNANGESADSSQASATPEAPQPPPAPAGLTATAGNAQVSLSWTASAGATSYNVKRATVSGGPYATIASPTTASYTDTTVTNGTTYYYVVSAVNATGESANSSQASATPQAPPPVNNWKFDETSGTTAADSAGTQNGTLAADATWAAGINNNAVSLNGTSTSFVSFPTGFISTLNDYSVAGWVKLNSVSVWTRIFDFGTGTSVNMFLTPSAGAAIRFAITTSGGAGEQQINGTSVPSTGAWHHFAVTLSGTLGILYVDGAEVGRNSNMTLKPSNLGSTTQNYVGKSQYTADPYLNGLVDDMRIYNYGLSAAEVSALATPPAVPPSAPSGLTATAGDAQVSLNWTASGGATSYNVKRATVSGGPYATVATGVTATTYADTTVTNGTTYYYVVSAVNATGESANSNESSATPAAPPPATPTFVAAGAVASGTGTTTPALPSGIATGDILLLFVETANQAVSLSNVNGGTWTEVTGSPQGTGVAGSTGATRLAVFWSRYNGTQGAPTVADSGNHQAGRMMAIRGAAASGNPWDVTAGGLEATSDTSASVPGATTTVSNTLVVVAVAGDLPDANGTANFSGWSNPALTNLTERIDNTRNSGNGGAIGVATGEKTTAGAYGNTAVTHAGSAVKGMITIAIKP